MSEPRVVHLASGDRWAGAEVATWHLLSALAASGECRVGALVLNPGELAERLADAGVEVRVVPEAGRRFRSLLAEVRPLLADADLVHAHRYKENLLAARSSRPWLATQHGRPERFPGLAGMRMVAYTGVDLWTKRRAARRVIAVSTEVEAWLARRVGASRVTRIWNGIVDPAPRVAPPDWAQRPRRVGVLGRLDPVKGIDLAVDAVARCPELELEVVGDGPLRAVLEQRAAASGAAARIRFVGFEADPLPRLAQWRALLVPSLHEGNPIGVIESLALGTPVLAADLPGVAEILGDRPAGWLQRDRDADAWAAALLHVTADPAAGGRASAAARVRYCEAFTAARAARETAALYREVLAEASARPARRWAKRAR